MNNFTTSLMQNLLFNPNNSQILNDAVTELFRSELEKSINDILQFELTEFLNREKYERSDSDNARNGFYSRKFDSKFGTLNLRIPRDRLGDFYTSLIPKYKRRDSSIEDTVIDLYNHGMTNSDIVAAVEKMCGAHYSRQTVSNITDKIIVNIEAFHNRPLLKEYAVVFTDATPMSLRRDTVAKEMVHIAVGITPEGTKEILEYIIAPTESAETWRELLNRLKDRGVERIDLICTDGLSGMENAITEIYPATKIQRCIVHISRNISSKVRVKDREEVLDDFKKVYTQKEKKGAEAEYKLFKDKWIKKYPKVFKALDENKNLFTFYDYPVEIRSSIYTTNIIEGLNKQIKRKFKAKEQFPTEQSMEKYLVSQFEQFNQKFMNRVHKGFGKVIGTWFKEDSE